MGRKLGNIKLLLFLAFLIFPCFVIISKFTSSSLFCPNHGSNTVSKTGATSFRRFLSDGLAKGVAPKVITASDRGYWSGEGLSEYHAWHFGPKLTSRLVTFFKSENNGTTSTTSIVDLGGGAGLHVKEFIAHGFFASCYDGAPDSQDISHGLCSSMDLTKPMQLAKYDWVLTLSVGRQIPTYLENEFITNIHRLNRKGIVIYWGDGKHLSANADRMNVKNNSQVREIFEKLGYEGDEAAGRLVRGTKVSDVNYSIQVLRKIGQDSEDKMTLSFVDSKLLKNESEVVVTSPYSNVRDASGFLTIATTSCGLVQMEEALTLINSAILFSQHAKLRVLVFADSDTIHLLEEKMAAIKQESIQMNPHFEYEVLLTNFPTEMEGMTPWSEIFKPCSLQRLFLPDILPSVDALIYFDADSIILSNLTEFWSHFSSMTPENFIGVTEATEPKVRSWYQKHSFPFYGHRGVNTGISLMNLTRMRNEGFLKLITKVRRHYEHLRPNETGDQFFQNILYSFQPEFVSLLPCDWNLRPLHCRCKPVDKCFCQSALDNGAAVIHGTSNAFLEPKRLWFFKNIYQIFNTFNFTLDSLTTLVAKLSRQFEVEKKTCFFKDSSSFYQRMEEYATNLQGYSV